MDKEINPFLKTLLNLQLINFKTVLYAIKKGTKIELTSKKLDLKVLRKGGQFFILINIM